ncbi:hypothetical protein NGM10_02740 [Halorussus salilacus]|uniref:DUF7541 family protein n=1 Tax=Halorussus salilacus TaxID=2953750 RepID=UPI0020A01671|nr:hypothetical protein [Halorussus salilacus]USZ68667.1 hypothetical protein NGM10_02740 [Halorussus salilacus]
MDEQPGLSDEYRKASPWPVFVAFGLAIFEVGIVMALFPVAVGGLLLFVGSVVGILRESEYVGNPWKALVAASVVCLVAGGAVALNTTDAIRLRGLAVVVGGFLVLLAGVFGSLWEPRAV